MNQYPSTNPQVSKEDPNAAQRKKDHIALAFDAQVDQRILDKRFFYEPMLSGHPNEKDLPSSIAFAGKTMKVPIWVSSMTGGTEWARIINHNLAKACQEFGMGMGLGSCRSILKSNDRLEDFDVRRFIGPEFPLFANLGIAQLEEVMEHKQWPLVKELVKKLEADGLIIHVNPFQEWLQPEGDRFKYAPINVIEAAVQVLDFPIIVKEVGQGIGLESLKALLAMPLAAIDFAANGGTNFSKLELFRGNEMQKELYQSLALVGHSASEMVEWTNELASSQNLKLSCNQLIISGGVKTFLDGYYLIEKSTIPAIYGQASSFLKHARGSYEELQAFVQAQIEGLKLAYAFLKIRT